MNLPLTLASVKEYVKQFARQLLAFRKIITMKTNIWCLIDTACAQIRFDFNWLFVQIEQSLLEVKIKENL